MQSIWLFPILSLLFSKTNVKVDSLMYLFLENEFAECLLIMYLK